MTDFDRDGNKEFFGAGWINSIGSFDNGIFECTGQGKYIFRGLYGCHCGPIEDISVLDTTHYNVNPGNSGMWTLNSSSNGDRSTIRLRYLIKNLMDFINSMKFSMLIEFIFLDLLMILVQVILTVTEELN
ncbi:MAG: hypothetical protein R2942_12800 [Ignavibacteria bacterium]